MAFQSEYQQQYVRGKDGIAEAAYTDRLRFRKTRKTCEMRHTPIVWLDNSDIYTTMDSKSLVEKQDVSFDKSPVDSFKIITPILDDEKITLKTVGTQTPIKTPHRRSKRKSVALDNLDLNESSSKQKKSLKQKKKSKAVISNHKKPIIQYGWNDQSSIVAKKTFNINAPSSEVKQSALSFAKIRETRRKLQLTREEKIEREKKKNQVLIDSLTQFDHWQTEYQRQYNKKKPP